MIRYRLAAPWLAVRRAARRLAGRPGPGFRIVLLHDVPAHRMEALDAFVVRVKRHHGVLSPAAAEAWIGAAAPPRAERVPCLFSFDDGFASAHAVAAEILARHAVKALFFVCPGLVEAPAARLAGLGGGRLMGWAEIEALAAMGHTIGAHGMTHCRLSALSGADLGREIAASGERLRARLGAPVDWFAYPFGDIDSVSGAALAAIGAHYRFCRSGVRGVNGAATHGLGLRADHVDLEAPAAYRALAVDGGLDFRYARARRRLDAMVQAHVATRRSAAAV